MFSALGSIHLPQHDGECVHWRGLATQIRSRNFQLPYLHEAFLVSVLHLNPDWLRLCPSLSSLHTQKSDNSDPGKSPHSPHWSEETFYAVRSFRGTLSTHSAALKHKERRDNSNNFVSSSLFSAFGTWLEHNRIQILSFTVMFLSVSLSVRRSRTAIWMGLWCIEAGQRCYEGTEEFRTEWNDQTGPFIQCQLPQGKGNSSAWNE